VVIGSATERATFPTTGRQVVHDDHIVTTVHKSVDDVRPDEAGPSGQERSRVLPRLAGVVDLVASIRDRA
jgi:hypothetical protein